MTTPSSTNPSPSGDTLRWTRGAPGSAFGGLTRGRGRPAGRGRGRRSARGTGTTGTGHTEVDSKQTPPAEKLPSTTAKPPSTPHSLPKYPFPNAPKSKPPPHHAPRNTNSAAQVTTVVSKDVSAPSSSSKPSNRRRRSHVAKAAPNPSQKQAILADTGLKRSQKSSGSITPHAGPMKDLPPHLTNATDIRNNIDALVERVRAVAMADNRPSTPGSHIDWAGDEDDSLPDLDDWGVVTKPETTTKKDMISPILMEGLKPLPEPGDKHSSPSIVRSSTSTGVPTPSSYHSGSGILRANSNSSTNNNEWESSTVTQPTDPSASGTANPTLETVRPLHPSLPRKPVTAPVVNLGAQSDSTLMQPPFPEKGAAIKEQTDKQTISGSTTKSLIADENLLDISEDGIASSIHAPSARKLSKPSFIDENHETEEGLAASIHAPSRSTGSRANDSPSTFNQGVSFSHIRAHTVGRFPRGSPTESSKFTRSGQSTPRGGYIGGSHSRTHSTPPTGTHRIHATRPVITGDAISRLARTIGNSGGSPPKPAAASSGE